MSKEHIEELLRKVSQSNNDDYLALTIGSLFSDMEQQNKRYREYLGLIEKVGTYADNETKEVIKNEQSDLASEALEESE